MTTATQKARKHHENSKGRRRTQQGLDAGKTVHVCTHAWRRGIERESRGSNAQAAVQRNAASLRIVCAKPGNRAAVDYGEAVAVVERKSGARFAVITILAPWMSTGRLPVVLDGLRVQRPKANPILVKRQNAGEEKLQEALAAHLAARKDALTAHLSGRALDLALRVS